MNRKGIMVGAALAIALVASFAYRLERVVSARGGAEIKEAKEAGSAQEKDSRQGAPSKGSTQAGGVQMEPAKQRSCGVTVDAACKVPMAGVIAVTGKIEADADRIAHVSPRLSGRIVSVGASLGDLVAAGQVLARLDSVELSEAINRYRQSRTKLALARSNMDRVKTLVDKKIAARKEVFQAETEYQTILAELQTDQERLLLYGLSRKELAALEAGAQVSGRFLVPVRSAVAGVVTEKHAIVGEMADPSKSLYTVADLSHVWAMVDINEKDLAKVKKGQRARVKVGAFPEADFSGRIAYIADVVDEATRTVKARLVVPNPGRRLKPEMFATVELSVAASGPPVLAVPEPAVQEFDGKKVLFVTGDGSRFVPREIALGSAAGGLVEVTAGLKEGERYASKGSFVLKSELKKGELGEE